MKNERWCTSLIALFMIAMGITFIMATYINSYNQRNFMSKTFQNYSQEVLQIKNILNSTTNAQLKNVITTLNNSLDVVRKLVSMLGNYKQISNYGHFYKFHNPMTYSEGVIACENINGNIIEFDERHMNYTNKLQAMIEEYGKHNFYVGLTDIEHEHYWKWFSSGRILAHTAHSVFDDGRYLSGDENPRMKLKG